MMNATLRLDSYVDAFCRQLRRLYLVRAASVTTGVLLLVSAAGAYLAIRTGFAGEAIITARFILLCSLAGILYLLVLVPLRQIKCGAAGFIEARAPDFAGRISTYLGMESRHNPLTELLAEDTLAIAGHNSIADRFRRSEFSVPLVIATLSLIVLIWLVLAGPGLFKYGVRYLWAGWAFPELLPPQSISVSPGDEVLRRGGSVHVVAEMEGFEPARAIIHARIGDGSWQEVKMAGVDGKFDFTFFSIREPVSYYVSAAGIRSPGYQINVIDLPDIEHLKLVYHYPEWVRRDPEVHMPGGDIRTVAGTEVALEIVTEAPLEQGELILNGTTTNLDMQGHTGTTRFTIKEDGQYFLAARVGREQVRLSDDYFIKIMEDGRPVINLVRPGRDWSASNIEEVTVSVAAADDFELESLSLRYSVNGGAWQTIALEASGRETNAEHVFFLEDMQAQATDDSADNTSQGLLPGDLISFYAVAADRLQTARTDMFFIDVQPFKRRFTQSQQSGSGGGQGQAQQEISNRQKEIIVSTWNLIRKQAENRSANTEQGINDNARLLSELQNTLAGRAQTLAERTRARQLSEEDDQIATFVGHLELAAQAMLPAAERLSAIELEEAILPEQEALQHLLRAEAVFNDVNVSFQRNRRGGGGSRAGSDLAEMFELEMDLEKNQYETGSRASPTTQTEEHDDALRKLEELARRQQQLADNIGRQQNLTAAQRWQQEMLSREAEELQRQLEQMQQQTASGNKGRTEGQDSSQAAGQVAEAGEVSRSELSRRLDSAIRAMNETAENMRNKADPEQLQRTAQEAQRQLQGARDEAAQAQQESMQASFQDMRDRAARLYRQQAGIDEELQEAVRRALAEREGSGQVESGLDPLQEAELAREKRIMSEDLQRLQQDMQASARQYADTVPEAVRELDSASRRLQEAEIDTRLAIASEYIRMGAAAYIASSESAVTGALRELQENLQRAQALARDGGNPGENPLDRAIAQTRQLRRDMQQLRNNPDGNAQQDTTATGNDGRRAAFNAPPPELRGRMERGVSDTARSVWSVMPELQRQGVSAGVLDDLRRIASLLDMSRFSRNNQILEQEYNTVLSLLEQLEFQLVEGTREDRPASVRSAIPEQIPAEYRDAVAEYYRRLSRSGTVAE
jgi:hypothetical protein